MQWTCRWTNFREFIGWFQKISIPYHGRHLGILRERCGFLGLEFWRHCEIYFVKCTVAVFYLSPLVTASWYKSVITDFIYRNHRIPKCVTNNLLLLTVFWQVWSLLYMFTCCFVYNDLMSLTGLLKWSTANKNMFVVAISIPCDKLNKDI